jgi:2-dehydro-3-deoxyphosphogluconate aldolase / (4S)-4-hydroxy-2-oxoglutarate aldolase
VTVGNVRDWFDAGAAAVGLGSSVTKAGDAAAVTAAAEEILAAIADARRR